jgi:hypothetical protein
MSYRREAAVSYAATCRALEEWLCALFLLVAGGALRGVASSSTQRQC